MVLDATEAVLDELWELKLSNARFFHLDHHLDVLINVLVQVALAFFLPDACVLEDLWRLPVQVTEEVALPLEVRVEKEVDAAIEEGLLRVHLVLRNGEPVGRFADV